MARALLVLLALLLGACDNFPLCSSAVGPAATAASPAQVSELRLDFSPVDFDADGRPDSTFVVASTTEPDGMESNAFGYGPMPKNSQGRCLKVVLAIERPGYARTLCGQSSVLILNSTDHPLPTSGQILPKSASGLSTRLSETPVGDVLLLPTEATDLAVYWTASGFKWEELSNGE